MTAPLLVGVLGSRIVSQVAAKIGYGDRELDLYPTSCLEPICAAGMLPVGVASADVGSGPDWFELITALVVPHDSRGDAGAESDAADHDGHTGLAVVVGALTRRLPVLAIGAGECLIAAALAEHAAQQFARAETSGFVSSGPDDDGGVDLADRLGVSASRQLSMLVPAASVPSGMHAVATGRGGSVYAVASDGGNVGPALSVRWDPASLAPGDQARDGPFRWLRDEAASRRPSVQPGRQEHPTEREEAK
jgi:hypothetical protein